MPQIIQSGAISNNTGADEDPQIEVMRNISFLTKEYSMGYQEVMDLPYIVFLSYLKWARVFQLESTEEGRDALYKQSAIHQTEPDFGRVRQHIKQSD